MTIVHNIPTKDSPVKPFKSTIVSDDKAESKKKLTDYNAFDITKNALVFKDPTLLSETETIDASKLQDTRFSYIQRAKALEIAISHTSDAVKKYVEVTNDATPLTISDYGNWRLASINGFCRVSDRVIPSVETFNLGYKYDYSPKDGGSAVYENKGLQMVKKVTDMTDTLQSLIAGENGNAKLGLSAAPVGVMMSRFQQVPLLEDAKGVKFKPTVEEVKLSFNFGCGGIYSGEEEVVKPILAFVGIFAPRGGGGHRWTTPLALFRSVQNAVMNSFCEHAKSACASTISALFKKGEEGKSTTQVVFGNLQNAIDTWEEGMYSAYDAAAKAALSKSTGVCFRRGAQIDGPYIPTSISWQFDYSQVDEFGFPTKGNVTLGGLRNCVWRTGSELIRLMGYGYKSAEASESKLPTDSSKVLTTKEDSSSTSNI